MPEADVLIRHPSFFPVAEQIFDGDIRFEEFSIMIRAGSQPKGSIEGWHRDCQPNPEHRLGIRALGAFIYLTDVDKTTARYALVLNSQHLPVDVDNRIVTWLCDEAARRGPELIVSAPPIHYGFNEHNMAFPDTITVGMEPFLNYVTDVCMSFVRQGHTRVVLVNGHGSNAPLCALVARRVVNGTEDALAAAINHWDLARDLAARLRESPVGGIAHACEYETSWYLFLEPELVRMERAVPDLLEQRTDYTWVDLMAGSGPAALIDDWSRVSNGSGVEGDPTTASAEKGRCYAEEEVTHLIRFCRQFKALSVAPRRNYTARGGDANPYAGDE